MNEEAKQAVAAFSEGSLERREALRSLYRAGMRGTAAYIALGLLPSQAQERAASAPEPGAKASQPTVPKEIQDPKAYISEQSKLLAQIAADPKVQAQLAAIQSAPVKDRPNLAVDLMKTIQSSTELQKRSTDDLRLSLRVFEREAQGDRNLGYGELSKESVVTAATIRLLNQKLKSEGTTPSLLSPPTGKPIQLPPNLQPKPIPGLFPEFPFEGMPIKPPKNPKDPLVPPRPIDPYALTICGSFGVYACVSVGG